jgi:putative endonuclease
MYNYYVYILTNATNRVLYTGVTNDLNRRLYQHRNSSDSTFSGKYKTHKLVYFEHTESVESAISREKQIKGGSRQDKIKLIESTNPTWEDLGSKIASS